MTSGAIEGVRGYHRAVHLSEIRQHMAYREADFRRDWETAVALSKLLAVQKTEAFERLLDTTFMRILACLLYTSRCV